MPTLRNVNPLGAVDLPLIGRIVEANEEFDCSDSHAAILLQQVGNYEPVGDALTALTVPQLKDVAAQSDVDLTGTTKKADIVAAIQDSAATPTTTTPEG